MSATVQSAFDLAIAANGPRRPLRVALLGFGTVGQSVARIFAERPELADRLHLTHVYNRGVSRKRVDWISGQVTWTERLEEVFSSAPDVVVEVMGGVEPAFSIVKQAMEQGASVVTANKMLLAAHGPELLALASTRGIQLRFEAAVGGGVPLIHGIREGLAGDQLTGVAGILNGTCNYILSRMQETDEDMAPVLADAQRLGYAEADPTADVDGHDAGAKLVVLAGIAFQRFLAADAIPKRSIRPISSADFRYARRLDCTIRQVSEVRGAEDGFCASVGPTLVANHSSFGRNEGANNVVSIYGRYGGESAFSGAGAGGPATAVAVVSDLLALTHRLRNGAEEWLPGRLVGPPPRPYYLRFTVKDQPGIMATIAAALARQHVNVDALLQEPGFPKEALPFVVTVDACEEGALRAALDEIEKADWHAQPPLALPMLLPGNS
ncbi:MAG TPA: homoserine dehydrogenase [Vicinamibacterales bacterium]|nr:homoserine dehydrogenase [Vicinamibacterales bacterium]